MGKLLLLLKWSTGDPNKRKNQMSERTVLEGKEGRKEDGVMYKDKGGVSKRQFPLFLSLGTVHLHRYRLALAVGHLAWLLNMRTNNKQITLTNTMRPIIYFSVRTLDMLSHTDIPGIAAKRITQIYSPLAAVAEEDPLWTLYGFTRPSRIAP